jgi:hypothetical protein
VQIVQHSFAATTQIFFRNVFIDIRKYHEILLSCIIADEIMAVIKLDNQTVAQTNWRPCSQQAWDQR